MLRLLGDRAERRPRPAPRACGVAPEGTPSIWDYDAWYAIRDSNALGREPEKAIRGWLFDRGVSSRTLYRRYGWVQYYKEDRPAIVADLDQGVGEGLNRVLDMMKIRSSSGGGNPLGAETE